MTVQTDKDQKNQDKHAMCNARGQSLQDAIARAEQFESENMEVAMLLEDMGYHADALEFFGAALHTVQDATSKAHANFQKYEDGFLWIKGGYHSSKEILPVQVPPYAYYATKELYNIFSGASPAPSHYFNANGSLWIYNPR